MLQSRSVRVMWTEPSPSTGVTGYRILYITTVSYTSGGSKMVSGNSATSVILSNLEEDTTYTIVVQSTSTNGFSIDSNEVTIKTDTAGK